MRIRFQLLLGVAGIVCLTGLTGCEKLYYSSMKKIGKEKRDILASRIQDGKKDQERAKEQIKTTMEAFQELTGFSGGNLEQVYKKLNGEYERSEARAKDVSDRIDSIDKVANDLFTEWNTEIASMTDRQLKVQSQQMLRDTQQRQRQLMAKMRQVESRMKPVLQKFHDKVVFLKHNLNARAIASLKDTTVQISSDVTSLVNQIDLSVKEADEFIKTLTTE